MIELVDPTRLNDSLTCLRYYYWRHERSIVPVQPRLPLIFGSAIHECLAEHYRGKTAGQCLAAFEKIWERDVVPFQELYLMEEDPKRNPRRWAEQFLVYRQQFTPEQFIPLKVEVPYFLPLTDKIAVVGIIDLVINYLNQIMLMDHKTTSLMSRSFFASFNPHHQFTIYLMAANKLIQPDRPITTLLVNCLYVHPTKTEFQRIPTTRSTFTLEEEAEQFVGWWKIVQDCRRTGTWPQNTNRCQDWGGCVYHNLCTDIQANFRKMRPPTSLFQEKIWDPIQSLREHGLEVAI